MKRLIITADDFGLCSEVNEAVIKAHRNGILTCASLMAGGRAAADAVSLAHRTPSLKVGLHLTLVNGFSVLPPHKIPDLVDADGRFSNRIVASGIRYFFSGRVKAQIARECEAQIQWFRDTGLAMDHINSHTHQHIHPAIREIMLSLVTRYNIPAVRLPRPAQRAPDLQSGIIAAVMAPWVSALQRRLAACRIRYNQELFGLHETGVMVESAWNRVIPQIRDGISEIYCHPAIRRSPLLRQLMPCYKNDEEYAALISPSLQEQLERRGIVRTTFSDLTA